MLVTFPAGGKYGRHRHRRRWQLLVGRIRFDARQGGKGPLTAVDPPAVTHDHASRHGSRQTSGRLRISELGHTELHGQIVKREGPRDARADRESVGNSTASPTAGEAGPFEICRTAGPPGKVAEFDSKRLSSGYSLEHPVQARHKARQGRIGKRKSDNRFTKTRCDESLMDPLEKLCQRFLPAGFESGEERDEHMSRRSVIRPGAIETLDLADVRENRLNRPQEKQGLAKAQSRKETDGRFQGFYA